MIQMKCDIKHIKVLLALMIYVDLYILYLIKKSSSYQNTLLIKERVRNNII